MDTPDGVVAAWNAARARRGLPPVDRESLAPALEVLAKASPGDPAGQAELAAAYVGLDDEWLRERGWRPQFLALRVDGLLVEHRRRRAVTPPVAASEAMVLPRVPGATAAELRPYARLASAPFTPDEEEQIGRAIRLARDLAPPPEPRPRWRPSPERDGSDTSALCAGGAT